jgi:hypothetical protein
MSLEFWIWLWKLVLLAGVGLFAGLAIVVTIGGAFDIGRLFRTLRKSHAENSAAGINEKETT